MLVTDPSLNADVLHAGLRPGTRPPVSLFRQVPRNRIIPMER